MDPAVPSEEKGLGYDSRGGDEVYSQRVSESIGPCAIGFQSLGNQSANINFRIFPPYPAEFMAIVARKRTSHKTRINQFYFWETHILLSTALVRLVWGLCNFPTCVVVGPAKKKEALQECGSFLATKNHSNRIGWGQNKGVNISHLTMYGNAWVKPALVGKYMGN